MSKIKPSLLFGVGMLLYAVSIIAGDFITMTSIVRYFLLVPALALEIGGAIMIARSPSMQNSRFRRWKLRLLGRG